MLCAYGFWEMFKLLRAYLVFLLVRLLAGLSEAKVKRKTFVAREDLIDRLNEVAHERGYSLYALVNEIFGLALDAEELGLDLRRIIEERNVFESARRSGFILGLESLWYAMSDLAYGKAKNETLKTWFDAGTWFAKRYTTSEGKVKDPLAVFERDLKAFLWNVSEFDIEKVGGEIHVRVVSPRFSEAFTHLFKAFIVGALEAFGYKTVHEELGRGIIRLEAKESNEEG